MRWFAALLMVVTTPVMAQSLCAKPGVPVCLDDEATYVSADRMVECQSAVREYVDQTMDYVQCLNNEVASTGKELKRNVDRFNCQLSDRKGCKQK